MSISESGRYMFNSEYFPISAWRAQAKAVLAPPTESFAGKTVLMTGASGSICSTAARILIDLGVDTLIFAVPDIPEGAEGEPTLDKILGADKRAKTRVLVWHLDLLSFKSVEAVAARAAELPRLDVALMGAATIVTDRKVSGDGWEYTLQINHLSCALLSVLLIPTLVKSAEAHGTTGVLTAITSMSIRSSAGSMPSPKAGQTLLKAIDAVGGFGQQKQQYGVTKLAYLYWLRELAKRFQSPRLIVHACDFGVSKGTTGIATINWEAKVFSYFFGRQAETCARVVANSCIAHDGSHGALLLDYDIVKYPNFMETKKGMEAQQLVWEETKNVLVDASPEAKNWYHPCNR